MYKSSPMGFANSCHVSPSMGFFKTSHQEPGFQFRTVSYAMRKPSSQTTQRQWSEEGHYQVTLQNPQVPQLCGGGLEYKGNGAHGSILLPRLSVKPWLAPAGEAGFFWACSPLLSSPSLQLQYKSYLHRALIKSSDTD